jgi:alkanesulfonate monooxygenase SsuD/methylene tetrahydromethanopterin reductase-like flavin-dependent oxidoreductase (luciferase family)
MRLDILHGLENRGGSRSWPELVDHTRRVAQLADELGYDSIWLGEHHFDAYGTDQCPNPVMLAADVAARTTRIRLGMAAITLPLWHPLRLAEDLAMLDNFSQGRLDVAFSRGILQPEIVNLNAEADRRNDAASRSIFAEHLEIVRRAWTSTPFSWRGERYEFPHPTTEWPSGAADAFADEEGHPTGLAIIPTPLQQPTPPLFSVTESRDGFISAAQHGLGVITWYPTGRVLSGLVQAYTNEAERVGTFVAGARPRCAILRGCCVAESDADARRIVEPEVNELFGFIKSVRGLGVWLDEGEDPNDPQFEAIDPFDLLLERDHLLVGSPASVVERMTRIAASQGIDHWLLAFFRGEDGDQADRTMRLMAAEVAPALRAAVHEPNAEHHLTR